jgi:hypothetical protein
MAFPLCREISDDRYNQQEKSYNQHRSAYESAYQGDVHPGLKLSGLARRASNLRKSIQTPHPAADIEDKAGSDKSQGNDQQYILWLFHIHIAS